MTGFRYLLHDADAEELGEFITAVPNWNKGDTFTTGDGRRFRILKMVPFLDDDARYNAMWMVEPLNWPNGQYRSRA